MTSYPAHVTICRVVYMIWKDFIEFVQIFAAKCDIAIKIGTVSENHHRLTILKHPQKESFHSW